MVIHLLAGDIDGYQKYFFSIKRGSFKVLFDNNYFDDPRSLLRNYLIVIEDEIVVGILSYLEDFVPYRDSKHLEMIEVAKEKRNQGLSKTLLESLFLVCERTNKPLSVSPYTEAGEKYIKPFILNHENKS
jgi:GNAT superfamily N-acetyltransferase